MSAPEIEEFAKQLIQRVRDMSVRNCDQALDPRAVFPVATRWRKAMKDATPESSVKVAIPDIVDETILSLLQTIDQGEIRIFFTTKDGRTIDLSSEGLGELSGWYMGSGGWRAKYAAERYADDFSDLNPSGTV